MFKMQACRFMRGNKADDAAVEIGWAKVKSHGHNDVDWIVDVNGNRVATIFWYRLLASNAGHLAQVSEQDC